MPKPLTMIYLLPARTRANGEFTCQSTFNSIPGTIGLLPDVFHFIPLGDSPKSLQVIVDDIAEILNVAYVNKILHKYPQTEKRSDPIIHFYETFLAIYDPEIWEKRGVY